MVANAVEARIHDGQPGVARTQKASELMKHIDELCQHANGLCSQIAKPSQNRKSELELTNLSICPKCQCRAVPGGHYDYCPETIRLSDEHTNPEVNAFRRIEKALDVCVIHSAEREDQITILRDVLESLRYSDHVQQDNGFLLEVCPCCTVPFGCEHLPDCAITNALSMTPEEARERRELELGVIETAIGLTEKDLDGHETMVRLARLGMAIDAYQRQTR